MKYIALALALVATTPVFAKGSSHPKAGSDGGGVIDAQEMPRARIWYDNRLWQTSDGEILVCEENFIVDTYNNEKKCMAKGDKTEGGRWSSLQKKQADGYVLKGYEYRFTGSGGYKQLIAYYGPPEIPQVPVVAPQAASVPVPNITVKIDRVIVQRKK